MVITVIVIKICNFRTSLLQRGSW